MTYHDILACLHPAAGRSSSRMRFATAIAFRQRARLRLLDFGPLDAVGLPEMEASCVLEEDFDIRCRQVGLNARYLRAGDAPERWLPHLHSADLIVAAQPDPDRKETSGDHTRSRMLRSSGVPTLLLPDLWDSGPIGKRIVVAWDASREATRAAHDALPFLEAADSVCLFAFSTNVPTSRTETAGFADHLRRHGVAVEAEVWDDTGDIGAADALFACLSSHDADMIVAGAYGHANWTQVLREDTTEALIREPTIPVLLSH